MNVNISLNLPELSDNSVWFANATAFNNFFQNVPATFTFPAADKPTDLIAWAGYTAGTLDVLTAAGGGVHQVIGYIAPAELTALKLQIDSIRATVNSLVGVLQAAGLVNPI